MRVCMYVRKRERERERKRERGGGRERVANVQNCDHRTLIKSNVSQQHLPLANLMRVMAFTYKETFFINTFYETLQIFKIDVQADICKQIITKIIIAK